MAVPIQLVVGLGNPGADYVMTRHNAGWWFVDALARAHGGTFSAERKFSGDVCRVSIGGHDVRLLKPTTFMNRSGQAVKALSSYLKVPPEGILVAHDDLDLPFGTVRLKKGGGSGGHNGLKDITAHLGENYMRARFGIAHPNGSRDVIDYVLERAGREEEAAIMEAIGATVEAMPQLLDGQFDKVTQALHSRGVIPRNKRNKPEGEGATGA
ncbi:MAG TPA: aminoacyl-tRNA hydrolase [Gammaproteobacteria bacterium]|jgi:PTH1 family peptidyl-tRNA hydrolase|nr:aminoacyl-tRNA hydrolase [Gammaproteobacteria bacterium]